MIARRIAVAVGLAMALIASQLPEYIQQYRQRLGGAVDELKAIIAAFEGEASRLSLDREHGLERLEGNADPLARERAGDMRSTIDRESRLEKQESDFARSGPVSQYVVLLSELDPRLAGQAYAAYQPGVPASSAGLVAALVGLALGWIGTHLLALPFRRKGRFKHADLASPRPSRA